MNQEMPTFDVNSIPSEFNPLTAPLDQQKIADGDDKLFVQFETRPVMNPSKSTQAGRPIYDDVDMIVIRTPGSQLTSVIAPIKYYMTRFGARYERWKAGQKEIMSGTPLENFPYFFGKPAAVAELKAIHVHTVEQLADLSDQNKQRVMGAHELCKRAKDWLSKTASDAVDAEKEEMKKQMAEMAEQIKKLSVKTPPEVATAKAVPKE